MAIRNVLKMGERSLYQKSELVTEFNTPTLDNLITDMFDTMRHLNGVGIAAPQIGVNLQVVIIAPDNNNSRYQAQTEDIEPIVLINPSLEVLTEEEDAIWEGCLCVPGLRGWVSRPTKVHYVGVDPKGDPIDQVAEGFHAKVAQHEVDHLNGVLYPLRIDDPHLFVYEETLNPIK